MDQVIAYLKELPHTEVKPGLSRIGELLRAVGNPHELFPTVHIGGTNGKGSVAAMAASVLQSAGYRVGLYTSPHLVSYCERIQIAQTPISEKKFTALADELMSIAKAMADTPTQFEFLTAMAFLHFAREQIDIAVVEVGIGGRFDATNVVLPLVSVLTNVELDHTDLLGDTIEKIAWEKSGIAKEHIPFVTGERKREALEVIERECAAVGAPLVRVRERAQRTDFSWEYQEFEIESLGRVRLKLLGGYQRENVTLALEALRVLQGRLKISEKSIITGLGRACWPGRFEVVQTEPFVIVLDGAHNPHGAWALREDLRRYRAKYNIKKSVLLFGVLKDKDYRAMAEILFPQFDEVLLARPDSPRALEPAVLQQWAPGSKIYPDVESGFAAACASMCRAGLLCVAGSLYGVGAVKGLL